MKSNKEKITITIDGQKIETEAGRNLVEVAKAHHIFIPSLCYFPEHKQPLGVCRVCTCSVDGNTKIACTQKVQDGMEVEINRADLINARKAMVEMMFSEGNHFCPSCEKSGNCDLQHMAYEMRVSSSRFPHLFKDRLVDFTPKRMIIEHNRCIKCMRCVEEVTTDEGKLRQIIINVLGNAVKFTEKGGITVRTALEDRKGKKVRISVEVEDTGCGIRFDL